MRFFVFYYGQICQFSGAFGKWGKLNGPTGWAVSHAAQKEREGERERLHWQSQLQLQLESDSDLEADSEWASWTWLGLAWLGPAWGLASLGFAWRAAANFTVTPRFQLTCWRPLARPINQMSRHRLPAVSAACRMPLLGIATATPTSSSHFFVDFILIYEDRFIWLPLLLHASHRSAAMSKFIADAR